MVARAQLQARFSLSKAGGCSPLLVAFLNQTTGAGATATYQWELGNGNTSAEKNPSAIYTQEKSYTVTLTVTDGQAKSSHTETVTVYKKPTLSLTADVAKGCAPLNVNFTAATNAGDGTIQSFFWDYGDGETAAGSGLATSSHTFRFAQKASVSLTVQNSAGCQSTVVADSIVNVLPVLEASFSTPQNILCRITDPVAFTNTSKGPGTLQYSWTFGDGNTSAALHPQHVYNKKGVYDISLTVTSSEGCRSVKTMPALVNAADFKSEIIAPDLYCTGKEIRFDSRNNPTPTMSVWDVDGYGTGWSPYGYNSAIYYFYTTGANRVRLVNTFGTCKDTVEKTFTIHRSPALQGFVASKSTECGAPADVQFRDTTAGVVKWAWNFNCLYNCPAPDATVQAPKWSFQNPTLQYVRLEVTNAAGCTASVQDVVDLQKPQMQIDLVSSSSYGHRYGCTGMDLTFKASRPADIDKYKWLFSDDNSSSEEAQPTHTFKTPGNFTVTLQYVLKNGCTGTAVYNDIRVRSKPKFAFSSESGTTICGNTPVKFTGKADGFQDWYWHLGDGTMKYIYGGQQNTIEHKYEKEGTYTVTLISQVEGCWDTLVKKDYLVVKPPFPKIQSYLNTCEGTRGDVSFTDGSKQAESWHWDFGDGKTLQYTTPPAEIKNTYSKTGSYKVVLTTTNGACTVKDSTIASVLLKQKPEAKALMTTACSDKGYEFEITGLEANQRAYYSWAHYYTRKIESPDGTDLPGHLLSLTGYDTGPYMKFRYLQLQRGSNQFRIILQSDHYNCADTTNYITVNIKGPLAGFTAEPTYCSGNAVTFNDTSKATGNKPIVSRTWTFGDGQQATYTSGGPVVHTYPYAGSFGVTLTVTDADGCTDQRSVPYLRVGGVQAGFTASATTVSPHTTVRFSNTSFDNYTGTTTFRWLFGDGASATDRDAEHTYTQPGTYTVLLLATSATYGCTDTARQVITVKYINSAYSMATSYLNNSACPPALVRFTNLSVNAARVSWDFGDGARAEGVTHPTHLYTKPGRYRITLRTYSDNGTEYTTIDSVDIKAPAATSLLTDKLMACTAGSIRFAAPGERARTYTWDFGDGRVTQSSDSVTQHNFALAGVYRPSVLVTDDGGCTAGAQLTEAIVIDSLQISAGQIPSACNTALIQFNPVVNSVAASSQGSQVLRYHWDFGTGSAADSSNLRSPSFGYQQPGAYTVRFSVSSPSGCFQEVTKQVVVDERIRGSITGPAGICEGASAQFGATAAATPASWGWNFGQGSTATVQNPGPQPFAKAGTYTIQLTTTNGACTDTSTHLLEVHALPALQLLQPQVLLCSGSSVQLGASGGQSYQWLPATGLDNAALANPVASPGASTTYTVTATSAFGCKKSGTVEVTVAPPMQLQLLPEAIICQGERVQLTASGAAAYQWIGATQGLSSTTVANPFASPQTTTTYQVKGTDAYNCFTDTASVTVVVAPLPTVNAGADVVLSGGNSHPLQPLYSANVVAWNWTPADYLSCTACATPVATPAGDITYTVTAKTADGCTAKDEIRIITQCGESRVFIPDAFTPNGDAKNPTFRIRGSGVKLVTALTIYNRWGERVYERRNFTLDDATAAWNGTYGGQPVPEGSYVYIANFQCASGEAFTKKGTVTVVR